MKWISNNAIGITFTAAAVLLAAMVVGIPFAALTGSTQAQIRNSPIVNSPGSIQSTGNGGAVGATSNADIGGNDVATTVTDRVGTKRLTAAETRAVQDQGRATAQRQDELNRTLDEALAARPGTEQGTAALAGLQTAWARRQEAGRAADSLFNRLCAKHGADPDRYRYSDDVTALEPLPEIKPPAAKGK